jgi:ADP-ribose pyrophosphatase YjhB (NUDIX family)
MEGEQKRAVVIIVIWGRKILLVKKGEEPWTKLSEQWALPAETLELGENDLDAVHRGVLEEGNSRVDYVHYLTDTKSYAGTQIGWYACIAQNPEEAKPDSDAVEVGWYRPKDVLSIYGNLPSHPLPEEVVNFLKER